MERLCRELFEPQVVVRSAWDDFGFYLTGLMTGVLAGGLLVALMEGWK